LCTEKAEEVLLGVRRDRAVEVLKEDSRSFEPVGDCGGCVVCLGPTSGIVQCEVGWEVMVQLGKMGIECTDWDPWIS
jgi:hypothetical protein